MFNYQNVSELTGCILTFVNCKLFLIIQKKSVVCRWHVSIDTSYSYKEYIQGNIPKWTENDTRY